MMAHQITCYISEDSLSCSPFNEGEKAPPADVTAIYWSKAYGMQSDHADSVSVHQQCENNQDGRYHQCAHDDQSDSN